MYLIKEKTNRYSTKMQRIMPSIANR